MLTFIKSIIFNMCKYFNSIFKDFIILLIIVNYMKEYVK